MSTDILFGSITKVESGQMSPAGGASIQDSARGFIQKYATLSRHTNERAVVDSAALADKIEAQNVMLKSLSRNQIKVVNGALTALQTQANHHTAMLQAQNRYSQIMGNAGKRIYASNLEHKQLTAGYAAYSNEFENGVSQAEAMLSI